MKESHRAVGLRTRSDGRPAVQFTLTRDAEQFTGRVWPFLTGAVHRNVLATVLLNVREGRYAGASSLFAHATDETGDVVWVALRTPPWPMIATRLKPPHAAADLVARWLEEDPRLPGVNGEPDTARAIAGAWAARTGRCASLRTRMAMHALERVSDPPRPAAGSLRVAGAAERPLLVSWWRAFARDAGVIGAEDTSALDSRLEHRGMLIWVHGEPVSMVGLTREVAGVVRLGPVYTPPTRRGHGYAGTAVAQASRRALTAGARSCVLYTDLANPTSNKIYAEVGYVRFADWEEYEFELE